MNVAHIPNIITALRIVGTFGFMFTEPLGKWFYIIYFFTGVTDVLDGFLARKLNVASELGAKLDSVADMLFNITMIVKILPVLLVLLPHFVWYAVGFIALMRIASYVASAVKFKKLASLHTMMNKITGFMIFTVPFFISTPVIIPLCVTICAMGIVATVEDFFIHLKRKEYSTDVKTIIS